LRTPRRQRGCRPRGEKHCKGGTRWRSNQKNGGGKRERAGSTLKQRHLVTFKTLYYYGKKARWRGIRENFARLTTRITHLHQRRKRGGRFETLFRSLLLLGKARYVVAKWVTKGPNGEEDCKGRPRKGTCQKPACASHKVYVVKSRCVQEGTGGEVGERGTRSVRRYKRRDYEKNRTHTLCHRGKGEKKQKNRQWGQYIRIRSHHRKVEDRKQRKTSFKRRPKKRSLRANTGTRKYIEKIHNYSLTIGGGVTSERP